MKEEIMKKMGTDTIFSSEKVKDIKNGVCPHFSKDTKNGVCPHFSRIPILVYHRISEDKNFAIKDEADFYTVSSQELKKQLGYLHDNGYSPRTLSALLRKYPMPDKPVIITFDDGDVSGYNSAWPILKWYGTKADFFLTVRNIGSEGFLDWVQVKEMLKYGMEFGSHGLTHRFLTKLDDENLANELENSKDILDVQLGTEIDMLSLPGGFYNRRVKNAAKKAGYRLVCTSYAGTNTLDTDLLALKRIAIRSDTTIDRFKELINMPDSAFRFNRLQDKARGFLKSTIGIKNYTIIKERLIGAKR